MSGNRAHRKILGVILIVQVWQVYERKVYEMQSSDSGLWKYYKME